MGRARRLTIDGGVYHVFNRGVNRQQVFFADSDRREFGQRLADIHDHFGVETIAYCLMTNHYHLVLRTSDQPISDAMHHLGSVFTRHVNDRVGRDGPLFRGRFQSIHVDTDEYLRWVVRYVHRNALALPGVRSVSDFRWSSMRTYLGLRSPPCFLNTRLVLGYFDDVIAFSTYHTDADVGRFNVDDAHSLSQLVAHAIAIDDLTFGSDEAAPQHLDRAVQLLLASRAPGTPLAATVLDTIATQQARSSALYRARRRADSDPRLVRIAEHVESLLAA